MRLSQVRIKRDLANPFRIRLSALHLRYPVPILLILSHHPLNFHFSFSLPGGSSDPGVTKQALLPPPVYGTRLRACFTREDFSPFFSRRLPRIAWCSMADAVIVTFVRQFSPLKPQRRKHLPYVSVHPHQTDISGQLALGCESN